MADGLPVAPCGGGYDNRVVNGFFVKPKNFSVYVVRNRQGSVFEISDAGGGFLDGRLRSRPRPTSMPSGILIHAAVWLQ